LGDEDGVTARRKRRAWGGAGFLGLDEEVGEGEVDGEDNGDGF